MAGKMDQVKGAAKDAYGSVTGDKETEAEGKAQKAKGKAKEAAHDAKETVKGAAEGLKK